MFDAKTLPALHREQALRLGPKPSIRRRVAGMYCDLTWQDERLIVDAAANALIDLGVKPGDRVGILSENRCEWILADLAILAAGAVHVPLHAPLSAEQVHYQLDDAGVTFLFVSGGSQLAKVTSVRDRLPKLAHVVRFADVHTHDGCLSWSGLLCRGMHAPEGTKNEQERRRTAILPDDLATIIYTSGTTGNPKGVMLSHRNLVSNARSFQAASPFPPDSVFLSWLPYSHVYARTVDLYVRIAAGATLALADNAETVLADLADVQPTNLSAVPRFYEKALGLAHAASPEETAKNLRNLFGRRVRWLGAGGAPLPKGVAQEYHRAGLLLIQGYGLTESSPVIAFNRPTQFRIESVGPALPGVEVRIADDGEVLSRGENIMLGYWNLPTETAEAIDNDGWLHTGDLGRLDNEGFLYITGRKKELLVLSNGKKVVPSQIEGLLLADPCIDQVVVCGEGKNFLGALVSPNWSNLKSLLGLITEADAEDDPRVEEFLLNRVQERLQCVAGWEQVKRIAILKTPFSVGAGELTVSLKLRRNIILSQRTSEVERIYKAD